MAKTLDFSTLEPDRPNFKDTDGTDYPFEVQTDFGAVTQARYNRTNKAFKEAMSALETDPSNLEAATEVEKAMRGVINVILPTLPKDRLLALKVGQMSQILSWWMEECGMKPASNGKEQVKIEHAALFKSGEGDAPGELKAS